MTKLEILVVEDGEKNRRAAQEYFNSRNDVNVNFVASYEDGLEKLQQEKYDFAIFDLELPKTEGTKPEKIGFSLAEKAEKYNIPWAIITTGIDHHRCEAAFVSYFWQQKKLHEITETPKTNQRAWKTVYEKLRNPFGSEADPIYCAMKRINPKNPIKVLLTPIGKLAKESLAWR